MVYVIPTEEDSWILNIKYWLFLFSVGPIEKKQNKYLIFNICDQIAEKPATLGLNE
jgi:hypothetical protein